MERTQALVTTSWMVYQSGTSRTGYLHTIESTGVSLQKEDGNAQGGVPKMEFVFFFWDLLAGAKSVGNENWNEPRLWSPERKPPVAWFIRVIPFRISCCLV